MNDFNKTVKNTNEHLNDNEEWILRFKGFADKIKRNKYNHEIGRAKFRVFYPFNLYSSVDKLKVGVPRYDLRFLGQSVATIKLIKGNVFINTTEKKVESNKEHFNIDMPLNNEIWSSYNASKFRKQFRQYIGYNTHSEEHRVESALLSEFKKQKRSQKALCNIQPILLAKSFFQMPTPIKASSTPFEYTRKGGGIDILARVRNENNVVKLCVMELKDENNKTEPPRKAMKQAIAYATFIAHLLRSESGNDWYKLFGFSGNVPKTLTIYVSTLMPPTDDKKLEDFNKESIEIFEDTYIELYSLYFIENTNNKDDNNYGFVGSLKDIMMK